MTAIFCLPAAISNSRGEFLLNGDFVVSMFKREIKVGNAVIEYSGSDHVMERINCTDRIEEEIVIQVSCHDGLQAMCSWTIKRMSLKRYFTGYFEYVIKRFL